jgi:protein TonB
MQFGGLKLDLDGSRIAANAGAIALNAAVLLLLLVPVALPPSSPVAERDPDVILVQPRVEPEPIVVPVLPTPPQAQKQPAPRLPTAMPQPDRPVVDSAPNDEVAVPSLDPIERADPGDTIEGPPHVAASTQLQAISAPSPPYPPEAIRNGLTGTVELEILVGTDGKPLEATVVRSSGHRVLDQAARKVVLSRWRFQPAVRDGQEVQALGRVPIVFTLNR